MTTFPNGGVQSLDSKKGSAARPNVLFIVVDDLRPSLGCYGYHHMITPNIDQLASKSVRFTNAFTQQAVCGPSRTSFLTSRRPDTTKLFDNVHSYWRTFAGNFTTLPQHFKENNYFTASVGKIFHPGKVSGKTDDYPYSWSQPAYHPSSQQYKMAQVCPGPDGKLYTNIVCPVNVSVQPEKTLPDIQTTQYAIEFLQNRSRYEQPFFLAVGYHKPHIPLKYPQQYRELYPLSEVHPAQDGHYPSNLPLVAWNPWTDLRRRHDVEKLNVSFPFGPLPKHYQLLMRQSYYAATTYMDDMLGQLLSTLDQLALASNTVISFIGDHGWSLGEHQEWSKFSNFEVSTQVPLITYVPGLTSPVQPAGLTFPYINPFQHKSRPKYTAPTRRKNTASVNKLQNLYSSEKTLDYGNYHGGIRTELVELVDLFPTISELAGLTIPPTCPQQPFNVTFCTEGISFVPLIKNTVSPTERQNLPWKKATFSQYPRPSDIPQENSDQPHFKHITIMGYTLRTDEHRYTEWVGYNPKQFKVTWSDIHGRELYLHGVDPSEDHNRAGNPDYTNIVKNLSSLLHAGWRYAMPPSHH